MSAEADDGRAPVLAIYRADLTGMRKQISGRPVVARSVRHGDEGGAEPEADLEDHLVLSVLGLSQVRHWQR